MPTAAELLLQFWSYVVEVSAIFTGRLVGTEAETDIMVETPF